MNIARGNTAVSQMISAIILLAIAITSVSIIYTQVLAVPGPQDIANVTIIGKMEDGHPVFDLQRGETLENETKIYITIAGGYNKSIYTFDQMLIQNAIENNRWNIGEQIILPTENVTGYGGPQVEGTIIDAKTNSIVFWGILQEGLITRHKGGIWHFDEQYWNINITNEVKDSSGNQNHGIAKNNALIINHTIQPLNTIHNNSGFFNVLRDAYVRVPSSWSLNISKAITVEAWMKPQLLPPIIDIVDLEEKFGYTPYIIHVSGDCYAIVSEDQSKKGTLQTVRITTDGNITSLNTTNFGDAKTSIALRPIIIPMNEKMFLIAYNSRYQNSADLFMHLRTYNISTNGSIDYTGNELAFLDYATSTPNRPSLQKITDTIFAISYWAPGQGGILKTVNISISGTFNVTSVKMSQYDTISGYEPFIVNISNHVIAIAYRGTLNQGILKTFNITSAGDILYLGNRVEFDSVEGYEPCLLHISDSVYAIAYRNTANLGYVKTFNIFSDGTITPTGSTAPFDASSPCYDPRIIHGDQDFYVIVYSTGNSGSTRGYLTSIKIDNTGLITTQGADARREFKIEGRDRCYTPIILHITEHLFAISFTGPTDHPGELITINIGMDTYPPHRGITKINSYGIYANTSTVVGSINNIMISAAISPGWHFFAVTYDSLFIRLYINATLSGSILYPNHLINETAADLLFGRNYNGYIDEIAIYDQALTQTQLQTHFINRGTFERFN
ncbi:MAG: LamG domain-containing protein [Candidatus Thermoplasmatota archaeon]|jgi:hypothetical protein|nr:LamG domain-containing protein [Candidatus Thermoplasmatota archaeon]